MYDKFMDTLAQEDEMERLQQYGADLNFRAGNTNMAIRHSAAGGNTYMYYVEKPGLDELVGVQHGAELPYLFDNPFNHLGEIFYPQECEFRHEIKEMWVNFARTGNPSSETVPPSASANETGFTEQFCDSVGFEKRVNGISCFLKFHLCLC